jgi:hypothetical protein
MHRLITGLADQESRLKAINYINIAIAQLLAAKSLAPFSEAPLVRKKIASASGPPRCNRPSI